MAIKFYPYRKMKIRKGGNFEKWKRQFTEKNGFYIPCMHDMLYFEWLESRKKH